MCCVESLTIAHMVVGVHGTRVGCAVGELGGGNIERAQLGLGHSYSRAKVKFNPGREDNMIIQAICLLDQLDKVCVCISEVRCIHARLCGCAPS